MPGKGPPEDQRTASGDEARRENEVLQARDALPDPAPITSRPPVSLAQVRSLRPPRPRSAVPWIAVAAAIVLIGGG